MKMPAKAGAILALALLCAGTGLAQTLVVATNGVADSVKNLSVAAVADSSGAKICSCNLLKIAVSTDQAQWVVVYAEKSARRRKSDTRLLKYYLRKERRRIAEGITYRIIQDKNLTSAISCQELFRIMQNDRHYLVLYSIIDLDILTKLVKR